ncbi:MAG: hypothetical protein L3K09_01830, partial [Thermoplasmata archaeon]|nr:hypothetical protein [Thermoplasmata archaeon]
LLNSPMVPVSDSEPGVGGHGGDYLGPLTLPSVPIIVTFSHSDPAALAGFLRELSNPSSPQYHHYLSAAAFDARFGGSPSVYRSAVAFFASVGVSRLTTYADRTTISFDATPSETTALFGVHLGSYVDASGRGFYAPNSAPRMIGGLARYVTGVEGLSDFSKFQLTSELSHQLRRATLAGAGPISTGMPSPSLKTTPCTSAGGPFPCTTVGGLAFPRPLGNLTLASDLQVTYGVQSLFAHKAYPVNESIATILWVDTIDNSSGAGSFCAKLSSSKYAGAFYPSDLSSFFGYTLPASEPKPKVTGVPILDGAGQAPAPGKSAMCDSGGSNFESSLDLEMAGSLAPGASLYEVYGDNGNSGTTDLSFADILNPNITEGAGMTPAAVSGLRNVSVISNSWGYGVWNDTSWYSDLQQAQARGITVLAATPDSGDNSTNTPAGQAYDSFGDVAVGGTTLRMNSTTLQRTSEIAWYEGPGSGYGSGGGVAASTNPSANCGTGSAACFPEPIWQRRSPDANSVITAVAKGRGEPDIAAIANDTLASVSWDGMDYSVSCAGTGGCSFFIFTGDSIATPVEAGVIASIDHSLSLTGTPRVGFLDPVAYTLGQAQFAGNLSARTGGLPFYDVHQYGNANFSALAGYDLVTGWGPIAATNYSHYLTDHSVTFRERGLPAGTLWSVTGNGVNQSGRGATIVFSEGLGAFSFVVGAPSGHRATPSSGSFTVLGASVTVAVRFT